MKKIVMSLSVLLLLSACGSDMGANESPTEQSPSEEANEQVNKTNTREANDSNQNGEDQTITFVPQKSDLDAGLSIESDETLAELAGIIETTDYSEIGTEDDVTIQYTGLYYQTEKSIQPIFMVTNKTEQSYTNMDMVVSFKSTDGGSIFEQEKFHLSQEEFGVLRPYTSMPLYLTIDSSKIEVLEKITQTRDEEISIDYFDFETVEEEI
ncbi:hypothetical protein [Atopostipes suicloacalis]|uniref:hypothetical protein n=1 Tax=Atopostipes suicloacalis TaxID=180295 RepID=UPI001177A37E|nr:hypothetical protein [Atopostipes suicloacalis]